MSKPTTTLFKTPKAMAEFIDANSDFARHAYKLSISGRNHPGSNTPFFYCDGEQWITCIGNRNRTKIVVTQGQQQGRRDRDEEAIYVAVVRGPYDCSGIQIPSECAKAVAKMINLASKRKRK